jgi:hypothetical protein
LRDVCQVWRSLRTIRPSRTLDIGQRNDHFRHDLIAKIGAWSIDHPNQRPDFGAIFADHLKRLKASYFEQQKKSIRRGVEDLLALLTDADTALTAEGRIRAQQTLERLMREFGYQRESARDAVSLLFRRRYTE